MSEDPPKYAGKTPKPKKPFIRACDRAAYLVPEKSNTGRAASEGTKAPPAKSDRANSLTNDDQP